MADVGIIGGEELLIQIEDPDTPGTFVHSCLINAARGVSFTSNLTETEVADCAVPANAAKIVRKVKSVDFQVTGDGKVDKTSVLEYLQWQQSGLARNAKIVQNVSGANGGFTGTGTLILSQFELDGERGDYQNAKLTFVPAAPFAWAANA